MSRAVQAASSAVDERPDAVIIGQIEAASPVERAVNGRVRRVLVLPVDGACSSLRPVADALALASSARVLILPAAAQSLTCEDVDALIDAHGPRGVIATDGVRDVPWLAVLPRARAAEAAATARAGGSAARFYASAARVRLADSALVGAWAHPR